MIFLIVLFVLLWTTFIYMVLKGKRLQGFYFKGLTSFGFILVFWYGFVNHFMLDNSLMNFVLSEMTFCGQDEKQNHNHRIWHNNLFDRTSVLHYRVIHSHPIQFLFACHWSCDDRSCLFRFQDDET